VRIIRRLVERRGSYRDVSGLVLLVICLALGSTARAQTTPIIIRLHHPPPARMNLAAMWDVTLTNPGTPRSILLYGIAHDGKGQFVGDGLTSTFLLSSGVTIATPAIFEPISYNSGSGYGDIIERTGKVPNGTYTFCVYVIDAENTRDTLGRDCITDRSVYNVSPIQLIHPNNESVVRENLPLFTWTSVSPLVPVEDVTYKLRIVELLDHQSAFEALQANPDWFVEEDLPIPLCPYPLGANPLEPKANYAWQVTAYANTLDAGRGELVRSEAWTFVAGRKDSEVDTDSTIVIPTDTVKPDLSNRDKLLGKIKDSTALRDGQEVTHDERDSLHVYQVTQLDSVGHPPLRSEITSTPSIGVCGSLKMNFKAIGSGDTALYAATITNNDTVGVIRSQSHDKPPARVRIQVTGDSIVSIDGATSSGLNRTPSKFPPGSAKVQWNATEDHLPNGVSTLGNIKFRKSSESSRMIRYEWLDRDSNVICRDSVLLAKSSLYYQLTEDGSSAVIEVPNDVLHVQYTNNYVSGAPLNLSLWDVEAQTKISSKRPQALNNVNGVNRLDISLFDYPLKASKIYELVLIGAENPMSLKFKIAKTR
jgi:hypothetical protein